MWVAATIPSGLGALYAVSCASPTDCVAVGQTTGGQGAAIETTNGGQSWSSDTVPSGAQPLLAVSCWAAGYCVATGGTTSAGDIYVETAGSFAGPKTEPSGDTAVDAVSCPSASYCAAAAYNTTTGLFDDILTSTNGGSTWSLAASQVKVSGQPVSLDATQCQSAAVCFTSGPATSSASPAVLWTTNGWSSFAGTQSGVSGDVLSFVDCPTATYCLAAGNTTTPTAFVVSGSLTGGSWSWSQTSTQPAAAQISRVLGDLCASTTTCVLVGANSLGDLAIAASSDGGLTWNTEYTPVLSGSLFGVACSPVVAGETQVCFTVGEQSGSAVLLQDNEGVVATGTPVTTPPAVPYAVDAWGGGSPSEVNVDQNIWVGNGAGSVNTATGDVSYAATDLTVPGPGIPLQFTRTYDAQEAEVQSAGSTVPPLGYGWSDNLNMSLAYVSGVATVTEEDGSQVSFVSIVGDENTWCQGLSTNFCATTPRVEATLNQNSNGTWTFTRFTGADDTYSFSAAGALTEIEDPAGDTLTAATYTGNNPSCPTGDSCTVWTSTPAQGATAGQLVLATDSANQLSEIFVPGASSQQVFYSYSGSGCTWGANTPDLCAVTDVLGKTTSYTYDGPSLEYSLASVTPPGGIGSYANTFNSAGQVTGQTNPVSGDTTYFYYGTATPTPSTTSLTTTTMSVYGTGSTTPDETEYDYADNLLTAVVRGLGTDSPGMASAIRNSSVLLDTSTTDADGNTVTDTYQTGLPWTSAANVLTSLDGAGNEVQAAYNADNQIWCSVDAADYANGTRCPASPAAAPPLPGTTDPNLGATISVYNAADELTAVTDPLGNTTIYAHTPSGDGVPAGLQYCAVDPVDYQAGVTCPAYGASHLTGTTTKTLNAAGYVVTSTDADGHTTSYTYSTTNPGLVAQETGPDGTVTSYTYDAAGHTLLTTVSFGSYSATTQVAYDGAERQFCEVAPDEYAKGVRCPALPITTPTRLSDLYLGATITTYNADSQVTQVTNPLGGITSTAYDDAGRAFCSVAPYEAAQGVTCPSAPRGMSRRRPSSRTTRRRTRTSSPPTATTPTTASS